MVLGRVNLYIISAVFLPQPIRSNLKNILCKYVCLLFVAFYVLFQLLPSFFFFFLIGIHHMQGLKATARHGVTKKEVQKGLQDTENLFRKILQLKDVC